MRRLALRLLVCLLVSWSPLAGCGKRGDPLPPLRKTPRAPGGFEVAQRGETLEVRLRAPTSSIDGVPLLEPTLEILMGEGENELRRAGERMSVAPGEPRSVVLPLPPPETAVRVAALAREGRRASESTEVVSFTVRQPPSPPPEFAARQVPGGVALSWRLPPEVAQANAEAAAAAQAAAEAAVALAAEAAAAVEEDPSGAAAPAPTDPEPLGELPQEPSSPDDVSTSDAAPAPPAEDSGAESPQPAPTGSPAHTSAATSPTAPDVDTGASSAAPEPTPAELGPEQSDAVSPTEVTPPPAPTPTPAPTPPERGVFVYRSAAPGAYEDPLTTDPLETAAYFDASASAGSRYCYVARTVLGRKPLIESAPGPERCLLLEDVEPPPRPAGQSVVATDTGIQVSWSPPPPGVATHRILRRPAGGAEEFVAEVEVGATRWLDADAPVGVRLVYSVIAVDAAGNESEPSVTAGVTRR